MESLLMQLQLLALPMQESSKRKRESFGMGAKAEKQQLRPQWHHRGTS